jgi:hypothetical protein
MMRLAIVVKNMQSYFFFCKELLSNFFSFEQSTGKCKWESYEGQAKFLDDLKGKQVIACKRGYGP